MRKHEKCAQKLVKFTELNLCVITVIQLLTIYLLILGLSLQAMDGSHVALVSLNLSMEGFEHYRADTNMVLGLSVATLAKVMKLADSNDSITLQAEDNPSHLKLIFENPKTERVTEFTLVERSVHNLGVGLAQFLFRLAHNPCPALRLRQYALTLQVREAQV